MIFSHLFKRTPLLGAFLISTILLGCDSKNSTTANEADPSHSDKAIVDYKTARSIFWRSLYANGGKTLYCGQVFQGGYNKGINIEHVFPMSWVTNGLECGTRKQCRKRSATFNRIEADLHNLYPSRTDVNQDRSSYSFGEVSGEARHYGRDCDFEVNQRSRKAEPSPAARGEVARAMFYMAYQYRDQGLALFARQGRLLEKWHQADPPSDAERARNDEIELLQGNRNPFTDNPQELLKVIDSGYFY